MTATSAKSESEAGLDPGIVELRRDRRLMVRPAPAGFRPKVEGPALEVRLVPASRRIKLGTPVLVRLEVQNVGSETWRYAQSNSLLKSGGSTDNDWRSWKFHAKGPDGRRFGLDGALAGPSLSEAQPIDPDEAERLAVNARAFRFLSVDLEPGETLVSIRRAPEVPDDWMPTDSDRLIEVANAFEIKKPGEYEIEAEHTARRYNPNTIEFETERTFRSDPIRIEVSP